MRKWLLIFLMLINVLVFFGYNMLAPRMTTGTEAGQGGVTLRLISELPESLLVKREKVDVAMAADVGYCWDYRAIQNRDEIDALTLFFQEQKVANDLQVRLPVAGGGNILLMTMADQEVINRINAVIKARYPHINIEKKLCKGVATP